MYAEIVCGSVSIDYDYIEFSQVNRNCFRLNVIFFTTKIKTQMFYDRVAICGGGLSSCSAASKLAANGIEVTIFEVGRGLGGRAATRRNGQTYFDHGCVKSIMDLITHN